MANFLVEHITYKHGGKQEDETSCDTLEEARECARDLLARYRGRVWINNVEHTRKDLV